MGRFLDFVVIMVALFTIYVAQFAGAAMLDPMRDEVLESGIDSKYDAKENFADMYEAVTVWVPTTASIGLIFLAAWREYRRQRVAGTRRVT